METTELKTCAKEAAVKGKEALRRRADIRRRMELTGYMQLINQTFIILRGVQFT